MLTFQELATVPRTKVWEGVHARLVHSKLVTLAIVELAPNTAVPAHQHVNEQLGFVIEGSIRFTVDGETREFGPGGTWRILANVPHEALAGPEGAVVTEVYSPIRADWAALEPLPAAEPRWPNGR